MRVISAGRPVELGTAPKPRLMLAILLAHADEQVSVDVLISGLWREQPPASARRNVHLYAHRLRAALGTDAIVSGAGGYAIMTGGRLDAAEFRALAREASPRFREGTRAGPARCCGRRWTCGTATHTPSAATTTWSHPRRTDWSSCA